LKDVIFVSELLVPKDVFKHDDMSLRMIL